MQLLMKLTRTYGACAILAREGDLIDGHLRFYPKVRFYPKAISDLEGAGSLCLQQDPPAGPAEDFAGRDFPAPEQIEDKTPGVNCMMTGSSLQKENPYQRKGIATRMVKALIDRHMHPELEDSDKFPQFIQTLEEQSKSTGLPTGTARDQLAMCLDLT